MKEFHDEGIEDVLGLMIVLWHAWHSVREQHDILSRYAPNEPPAAQTSSTSTSNLKRKLVSPPTKQAKRKLRRFFRGCGTDVSDDSKPDKYQCLDPQCTYGRLYKWEGLHDHM